MQHSRSNSHRPVPTLGVSILRAAAADGAQTWQFPEGGVLAPAIIHSDPLAAATLGAAAFLCVGVPLELRRRTGLVIGTTLGCLEVDRAFDRSRRENARYASPATFARTLPSTIAAEISLAHQLVGPSLTLSAGAVSAAMAVRRAAAWMEHFDLSYCIAGGMDCIGPNATTAEICQVALLLLGKTGPGIGRVEVETFARPNITAHADESLGQLLAWFRTRGDAELGAGVSLRAP